MEVERLERESRTLANLGVVLSKIQVGKKGQSQINSSLFNYWEFALEVKNAKETIEPEIARLWLEQYQKGNIPRWAQAQIPIRIMELSAS